MKEVEGHPGLRRDASGVIINIDTSEIKAARLKKKRSAAKKAEESKLKDTVKSLQSDMAEMKDLLSKIAERLA
tara:strand:- start:9088 stop:9306 length:219 start_codon:yes stop_codon:yes gene_type:complete